jgi:hypothetical protein
MENNTTSKEFNAEESIKAIVEMIQSTKSRIGKNYFYYLFWGYLVAFTAILEYLLLSVFEYSKHYMVWPVFMTAGSVITVIFYVREAKSKTTRTFVGTAMEYLWLGWFISFSILMLFVNLNHYYMLILPLIMVMYGLGIFVAGGIVNFRPLMVGGVVAWLASLGAFFTEYPIQLIILAVMVIVSHIVPGHMLKNQSKS